MQLLTYVSLFLNNLSRPRAMNIMLEEDFFFSLRDWVLSYDSTMVDLHFQTEMVEY